MADRTRKRTSTRQVLADNNNQETVAPEPPAKRRKLPKQPNTEAKKLAKARKARKRSESSNSSLPSSVPPSPSFENVQEEVELQPLIPEQDEKLPEELLKALMKPSGVLMISGLTDWDAVGRSYNSKASKYPALNTFHKLTEIRYRAAVSGCSSAHSLLITDEGQTFTFGRNDHGQLGLGTQDTQHVPKEVTALSDRNIIHAATGRRHTLFLSDAGVVYACGDNRSGQCGVGNSVKQLLVPTRIDYTGAPIVKIGCGGEFSMILDMNGALHSFGHPEHGQLGQNSEGNFIANRRVEFDYVMSPQRVILYIDKSDGRVTPVKDVQMVDFSCGVNHAVAIDSQKRAFSWGFGGYGRLGHSETNNELVPRLIKWFEAMKRGVRYVQCGSTYTYAVTDIGGLTLFGHQKPSTGVANMYPKYVQDLSNYVIRSIGAGNTSVVVAAGETLVAWGASPTYGELGFGGHVKSSTKPMEVKPMIGLKVHQVSLGHSHSLLIVDDSNEASKEKLANKPVFNPKL